MEVISTVVIDRIKIEQQFQQAAVAALEKAVENLKTVVQDAQVVPRDTGRLQGEAMFVDSSESAAGYIDLVHEGPYARRLYYHPEYNFSKKENPNAKGKWMVDWLPGGESEDLVYDTFEKIFRMEMGI